MKKMKFDLHGQIEVADQTKILVWHRLIYVSALPGGDETMLHSVQIVVI